jgi:hypothetical protein
MRMRRIGQRRTALSNSGYGVMGAGIAVIIVVIVYSIVGGRIISFPTTATVDTTSPTSTSSLSSSASLTAATGSSAFNFNPSGNYKILFTGKASDSETHTTTDPGYCGGGNGNPLRLCESSETTSWTWNFVYYYSGGSSPNFPAGLNIYLNYSTVSLTGTSNWVNPTATCMATSNSIVGPGAMTAPLIVYSNGTVMNAAGYDPWDAVANPYSGNDTSFCATSGNVWIGNGDTFYAGYNGELNPFSFLMDAGTYSGLGGSITAGTCPTSGTITVSCVVYPYLSSTDSWSGTITVTAISCTEVPTSLQNC